MTIPIFKVIGLMSLYFPLTITVKEKNELTNTHSHDEDDGEIKYGANHPVDNRRPVFDVSVPFLERNNFITHCCILQIASGIMIICAAYGMGSHIFSRFLLGCTWMFIRFLIVVFELTVVNHLFKTYHGPLLRYGYFVSLHVAVDIYFFIIVRYYTMECYDSFRYQNLMKSYQRRRESPTASKAAPKTKSGIGKQKKRAKGKKTSQVETDKNVVQVRDIFQKKRDLETGVERVPVWDRKNEVIFYGEDYTDWDPAVFQARWEMLNEKEKEKAGKTTKSSKRKGAANRSMALEFLARAKNAHIPVDERHTGSTVTAPEHFDRKSSRTQSLNAGSTVSAPEQFGRKSSRSQSVNAGSTVDSPEHFDRNSSMSQRVNAGSTVGAPEYFDRKSSRSQRQRVNAGSTVGAPDRGRRSSRSQSLNDITQTDKSKQEKEQEVNIKPFHWSGSRQKDLLQPFRPVIQRPSKRSARSQGSVLQKLRKETAEKK